HRAEAAPRADSPGHRIERRRGVCEPCSGLTPVPSPWRERGAVSDERSTPSGIPVEPVYGPESRPAGLGATPPGEFPYTRGIYPTMYRGRLWTMRQYAGFGTAVESNQSYRYLLSQGQTGLYIAYDLPTQIGLDSDHPLARGEVGKVGVAIDSLEY